MRALEQTWVRAELGYAAPWLDEAYQATLAGRDAESALRAAQVKVEALAACLKATQSPHTTDQLLACARQADPAYPVQDAGH